MEPPHTFVRDASASVVHHDDYLNKRDGRALCGMAIARPAAVDDSAPSAEVCPECAARLVEYHLVWWRDTARAAVAELEELRVKFGAVAGDPGDARDQPAEAPAPRRDTATAEPDDAEPASLLEHARRELLQLCREFDDAVPYRRVKIAMQSFSDNLSSDERALLAQQIGNDGSLMRWSTIEVETQGWHVTDNPVQGETEAMWDAWANDAYQTPKPSTKRWLGRSRSRDRG